MSGVTRNAGFTLGELTVGLALFGIVAAAALGVLVRQQRLHAWHTQRAAISETLRTILVVVPAELRELDPADGDLIEIERDRVRYKAMRGTLRLCGTPDTGEAPALAVERIAGEREISPARDSLVIFAERDPSTRDDDTWVHVDVTTVAGTGACSPAPGLKVGITAPSPGVLTGIEAGAPARYFEPSELLLYRDRGGDAWLGGRSYNKATRGWSVTQPIAGPLAASGLRLSYLAAGGAPAASLREVARIAVSVVAVSMTPVRSARALSVLRDSIILDVDLRNGVR